MEISPCCCRVPRTKAMRAARSARLICYVFNFCGVDVRGGAAVISLAIAPAMFLMLLI